MDDIVQFLKKSFIDGVVLNAARWAWGLRAHFLSALLIFQKSLDDFLFLFLCMILLHLLIQDFEIQFLLVEAIIARQLAHQFSILVNLVP